MIYGKGIDVKLALLNNSQASVPTPFVQNQLWKAVELTVVKAEEEIATGVNIGNFDDVLSIKKSDYFLLPAGEIITGRINTSNGPKGLFQLNGIRPGSYKLKASMDYSYAIECISEERSGDLTVLHTKEAFENYKNIKIESGTIDFEIINKQETHLN
jgi:hypothetical protein